MPGARGVTSSFSPRLAQRLEAIGNAAYARPHPVLAVAAVIAVAALAGVRLIHVDSDFLSYFEPDSEVRRDNEIINRKIVGSNPFYLVIEGSGPGTLEALGGAEADQGPADLSRHAARHHGIDLDRRLPGAAGEGPQQAAAKAI